MDFLPFQDLKKYRVYGFSEVSGESYSSNAIVRAENIEGAKQRARKIPHFDFDESQPVEEILDLHKESENSNN